MLNKITVLMSQSLLAQGIVSRLRRTAPALEVEALDIEQPDVCEKLLLIQPRTLIVETEALAKSPYCTIDDLFRQFPNLTVIEVTLETPRIQLIQSGQLESRDFGDLLSLLERTDTNAPGALPSTAG